MVLFMERNKYRLTFISVFIQIGQVVKKVMSGRKTCRHNGPIILMKRFLAAKCQDNIEYACGN
jgi:hypothetical protein